MININPRRYQCRPIRDDDDHDDNDDKAEDSDDKYQSSALPVPADKRR